MVAYGEKTYFNFKNIDDDVFNEILIKLTRSIASHKFNLNLLDSSNVYNYISFKDGDKLNLHRDNLMLKILNLC
jgi:hypothetical protein